MIHLLGPSSITSAVQPTRTSLLASWWVRGAVLGWLGSTVLLVTLAGGHLPFHASSLSSPPTAAAVLQTSGMFVEVFALMVVVRLMTRRRGVVDLAARAPERSVAAVETAVVLGYGVLAMAVGDALARAFGWHAFGFHLDGMVIRTDHDVVPQEAIVWALYNFVVYAVVPLAAFRRRYSSERLNLRSTDRRADLRLILVVLAIESTVQLTVSPEILRLSPHQILLGAPLTFVLSFLGTVLPTMVFVYCILAPRYLRLTGSAAATVILGGVTYAALHLFDGWTSHASPTDVLISSLYVLLFYTAPGMFKTFLTLRTGNAWVHVWAYHAIAPHTLVDTPMFVRVFAIR